MLVCNAENVVTLICLNGLEIIALGIFEMDLNTAINQLLSNKFVPMRGEGRRTPFLEQDALCHHDSTLETRQDKVNWPTRIGVLIYKECIPGFVCIERFSFSNHLIAIFPFPADTRCVPRFGTLPKGRRREDSGTLPLQYAEVAASDSARFPALLTIVEDLLIDANMIMEREGRAFAG